MTPKPYRSSYMASKKGSYGDDLTTGRRLGRHLPRIASGDAEVNWSEEPKVEVVAHAERQPRKDVRETRRNTAWEDSSTSSPAKSIASISVAPAAVIPGAGNAADVAGIPGRLKFSRDRTPAIAAPLPSARLNRGLWVDTQRQHLQAYEYLCHVGEAQQWIEGCLEEELGFGVVEMEEELRNGVVLAKLVRKFQGEAVVRRIYEARSLSLIRLDYSHSLL